MVATQQWTAIYSCVAQLMTDTEDGAKICSNRLYSNMFQYALIEHSTKNKIQCVLLYI